MKVPGRRCPKRKPTNTPAVRLASDEPAVPPKQLTDYAAPSADPRQRLRQKHTVGHYTELFPV